MMGNSMLGVRAAVLGALLFALPVVAGAQEVNLYTTREPGLIQPLLDAFTKSTGIKVNSIFVKDGLAERVAAEGAQSPADVLMTVDFGNLLDLTDKGLTQPVQSAVLEKVVPANLRGGKGEWFALSLRARVVYASKTLGLKAFTYEELADPKWKGKVCIRSGQHPYNTALIAAYIAHHGEAAAETWLRGVKANLGRAAAGGDREVARDIMGAICDIGVANSVLRRFDAERSRWAGPTQMGSGDRRGAADVSEWRHARESLRCFRGEARAAPRRRGQVAGISGLGSGTKALRGGRLRVSRQGRSHHPPAYFGARAPESGRAPDR